MKKLTLLCIVALFMTLFHSCTKNNYCCSNCCTTKVDANGLTADVHNILSDSLLLIIKNLGMPINGGANPPTLQGTYLVSKLELTNSNISSDVPGTNFADFRITFKNQNTTNLTVDIDYVNGPELGNGIKSYVVGDGKNFTVFAEISGSTNSQPFKNVYTLSGTMEDDGIHNFKSALTMTNDFGDPLNQYISIGDTRVFKDSDGFSPKQ